MSEIPAPGPPEHWADTLDTGSRVSTSEGDTQSNITIFRDTASASLAVDTPSHTYAHSHTTKEGAQGETEAGGGLHTG